MKKKHIAFLSAGMLGWGAVIAADIDERYNDMRYTNTVYCSAYNFFNGNDTADVEVMLYMDKMLPEEQRKNASAAFSAVKSHFIAEFGISLIQNGSVKEIELPDDDSDWLPVLIRNNADMSIIFMRHIKPGSDEETTRGTAYQRHSVIGVDSSASEKCLENILAHEIGHLFYAEHTENPLCIMYRQALCEELGYWCDEEMETIRKYRHRIW